ncbi:MAG: MHS family MFS transporter [Acidobacteria bacterium]|nr:MHS family MFS transporter [Acidobacteriota bacterium]
METNTLPYRTSKAVIAGVIGNLIEWYDFALYGYFAPVLAKLFFPSKDPAVSLISTFGVFATGFLMRPVGGAIFGHFGDKVGRRKALSASVFLMAIATTSIGLLPTYTQVGVVATILLTLMRLLQGLSAGGQFTGSISLLVEHAPESRRGFIGSWTTFSGVGGMLLGSGTGALVASIMSDEALQIWGWRIPFLLGILTGVIGLYLRFGIEETPGFKALEESGNVAQSPLKEALQHLRKEILIGIGANWLNAAGFYTVFVYNTTYLSTVVKLPLSTALMVNTISMIFLIASIPIMGGLSDRVGRKPILISGCLGVAVLAYPLFHLLSQGTFLHGLAAQLGFVIPISMLQGTIPTTMVEIFPTRARYSALSIAYNIAFAVFGGTAPLVATKLISATKNNLSPSFSLIISAVISLLVIARIKETYKESLR